jgi:anhydro-N-acetylmuramic acid kinase
MATLNRFSGETIAEALQRGAEPNSFIIYTSGGGMHNPLLLKHLQELLPNTTFKTTADLQINPDAKEAVLFAILANECICGDNTCFINSNLPNVSMGKISFPD